jgi:ubiquinone/menaquinone biosynthesis C-methylase UbiE
MIKYVSSILNSKGPNSVALKYLVFFALIVLIILLYKTVVPVKPKQEGFDQAEPFVLKRDHGIYDDFYTEVYDELNETKDRTNWEVMETIKMTNPTQRNSVFLDVGSGTGALVNNLVKRGYRAYGIDSAKSMVSYSEKKYPDIDVKCENVKDSMTFDRSTFTHITCTNFTIYQIQDKAAFFKNCYFWMVPNAYLILHLVDRSKFSAISPLRKSEIQWMPFFKQSKPRVTDKVVDFDDFHYRKTYKFSNGPIVTFTETFTDKGSNHVRQNEQTLYMEDINDIVQMASRSGFIVHGKVDMKPYNGDENQFLYVLERQL